MKKKVLIIDDDIEIVKLLKIALENKGFSIDSCYNHSDLKTLMTIGIDADIILLDYFLPEVNGLEIAKMLLEKGIKIPIIFFTASDAEKFIDKYPENIVDSIKKPFSIDSIVESLNRIIKLKNFLTNVYVSYQKEHIKIDSSEKINDLELQDLIFTEKANSFKLLLNNLSHKIKNSLQTIINYTELFEKGYIEEDEKERFINTIKRKSEEIKEALNILKKPERGIVNENFSLKNAIKKVLYDLKNEIKQKNIYVKTNLQNNIPLYYGNKWSFILFLKNLLSKSIDCINYGGKIFINLHLHQQEYIMEIKIEDIKDFCENKLRFFDPSKNQPDSLELTKAIVILKDMGGKIQIQDIDGSIVFNIQIPMRCINV